MSRPAPRHAPRVPFALLLVALVVGGLAVLLGLNTASAANELRRHDLVAQDNTVAAQVEQLRDQIARSRAPGNLARAAAQLGMVPAANPAFLDLRPGGSATILGHPSAVPTPAAPVTVRPTHTTKSTATSTAKATAKPTAKHTATSTAKRTATPTAHPTHTAPGGTSR